MEKDPSTFGLSPRKVANLLKVGSDSVAEPAEEGQQKAERLSDILNAAVAYRLPSLREASGRSARDWTRTVENLSADPVGKLLQDPGTDTSILKTIKEQGRSMSSNALSKVDHQAANTIYFAAIAHALLFHGMRITQLSYDNLDKSFRKLAGQDWIPEWLRELFERAGNKCSAKRK